MEKYLKPSFLRCKKEFYWYSLVIMMLFFSVLSVQADRKWTTHYVGPWAKYALDHGEIGNNYISYSEPYTGNVTIAPYVLETVEGKEAGGTMMIHFISGSFDSGGWIVKTRSGYSEGEGGSAPGWDSHQLGTFYQSNIDTLRITEALIGINYGAFEEAKVKVLICSSLTPPQLASEGTLSPIAGDCELIVPTGYANVYQQADQWKDFKTIKEGAENYMPALVTEIDGAYYQLENGEAMLVNSDNVKKNLIIPDNIQYMGKTYPVTDLGKVSVNRYRYYLKELTLGANVRHFSPDCMQDRVSISGSNDDIYLEAIHVSPDNPYFSEINGGLYTKDYSTFLYIPRVRRRITSSGESDGYYTIADGVKTIAEGALPAFRNGAHVPGGYLVIPPSVERIEKQGGEKGKYFAFWLWMISEKPPVMEEENYDNSIYVPKGCLYNYLDVKPYDKLKVEEDSWGYFPPSGYLPVYTDTQDFLWDMKSKCYDLAGYNVVDNNLKEIVLPSSYNYGNMRGKVKTVGIKYKIKNDTRYSADFWNGSNIQSLYVPEGIEEIYIRAYSIENIRKIKLPSTLKILGASSFRSLEYLQEIDLPDGLEIIEDEVFRNSSIKRIVIPASVKKIGSFSFVDCKSLTDVYMLSSTPPDLFRSEYPDQVWNYKYVNFFSGTPSNITLHVPTGAKSAYAAAVVWGDFTNIVEDSESLSTNNKVKFDENGTGYEIQSSNTVAITGDNNVKSEYKIPETVSHSGTQYTVAVIGKNAFEGNTDLKKVTIPQTIEQIDQRAFAGCSNLSVIYSYPVSAVSFVKARQAGTRADGVESVFEGVNKETCIVYVPVGSVDSYRNSDLWKDFKSILEMGSTSISTPDADCRLFDIYDLSGRRVRANATSYSGLAKGIYVVNGKKIVMR